MPGELETGFVTGRPRVLLRLEGVVLFVAALAAYTVTGRSWWLAALLLLAPDVFMVGYARSSVAGALLYNLAHAYPVPAVVGAIGLAVQSPLLQAIAVIWFAHIGMDRALGFGLKYDTGFADTHLGRIGPGTRRHVEHT